MVEDLVRPALRRLRAEKKFAADEFYPGAPTELIRLRCEARVNRFQVSRTKQTPMISRNAAPDPRARQGVVLPGTRRSGQHASLI